jgi:integrase
MKISDSATLTAVMEEYLLTKEVCKKWHHQVEHRVCNFIGFLGGDIPIATLSIKKANEWLISLRNSGKADVTVHGYRTALHAVWMFAYMEGFTEEAPLRMRRVSRPPKLVTAFTKEELLALRSAALTLKRNIEGTVIPRSLWWAAYIPAAYSTGLRKGCLLAMERRAIQEDGIVTVIARKTKKVHTRRLDRVSIEGITEIGKLTATKLAFPMARTEHVFFEDFRQIAAIADMPYGCSSKWIRRSAISYAEAGEQGAGRLLGGHTSDEVTNKSYRDFTIAPEPVVEPPAIDWV